MAKIPGDVRQELKDEAVPEDLKEIVHRIAQDTEDMELRLSEYKFIHSSRMLGVAVGGAIFLIGILSILISIFMFSNLFNLTLAQNVRIVVSSSLTIIGATQLLAGVLLMGK